MDADTLKDWPKPREGMQLSVTLDIQLATLATWPPATARALLLGVAQCISAQQDVRNV